RRNETYPGKERPMVPRDAAVALVAGLAVLAPPSARADQPAHEHAPAAGAAATVPPPLFTDLGHYHRAVTTAAPKAQQYFDQGLRLLYAFNLDEAQASFAEAARLDPSCAMCFW